MKNIPVVSLIFRPCEIREFAAERAEIAAVVVNAVNGMLVMAAILLPMLPTFTTSLVALMTILFGPFAAFAVSSLYSRVEWTVGGRLGGKASLDELYRLFAWSFFPAGVAVMLYGLILLPLKNPSAATELVASIPSLVIFCLAIRNYCSNIIASQRFTRTRGIVCVVLSIVMFLVLMAGGILFLVLLCRYGMGEGLYSVFSQL